VKKSWILYGFPAVLVVAFAVLWIASGDFARATILLINLLLGIAILVLIGALTVAILGDVVSEVPLWFRRSRGIPWQDHLNQLEADGKAIRSEYEASGALTVEDYTTGRLMHFIDIGNGKILCLYGQQYYEFEPISDDPDLNQARLFPTETFSLLRHSRNDEVLALFPGSVVLETTNCDPIVEPKKLIELGFQLRDGEIVSGSSLKAVERVLKVAA
jgi:hypothetical protein